VLLEFRSRGFARFRCARNEEKSSILVRTFVAWIRAIYRSDLLVVTSDVLIRD
jgi:hypothetical protein